jgi:EmrB/QacA subfamily drug resistance transporter
MEQTDSTVIATSLPAIAADIGTSPVSLKLALTSYLVSAAIFIPISGWMSDRVGAKSLFRAAIVVFALGSIACVFAGSIHAFVLARFLQGMGGSMMTPVSRLLLVRDTPRDQLVSAMAWLTVPALVGPIIGGFLTTYLSWHWIFWINVPISLVGLALVTCYLPKGDRRTPRPIDLPGFLLSAVAFSGLVYGLSVISFPTLPTYYGGLTIAGGALSGAAYVWHARRAPYPLLDPAIFRDPLFRAGILGGSLFRVGIGAIPFLLPLMLQLGFGFSPMQSGMVTFIDAVGALSSKLVAQCAFQTLGFRTVLSITALLSAAFTAVNSPFNPTTPVLAIMGFLLVGGILRSICFTGVNALVFSDVNDADSAPAATINSVAQQVSRATGVALAGATTDMSAGFHGQGILLGDFHVASAVSALATFVFLKLSPEAGAAVSRHRPPAECAAVAKTSRLRGHWPMLRSRLDRSELSCTAPTYPPIHPRYGFSWAPTALVEPARSYPSA